MPKLFKSLLGLIILISAIGLATCQSLVKAETLDAKIVSQSSILNILNEG